MRTLETERQQWAQIAKDNGWHKEPFYVQVWRNEEGDIMNSVSHRDMKGDIEIITDAYTN